MDVLHKALALAPEDDPYEFIMSDESVDRMGDVIEQAGWKLANFTANPIALFGHDSSFPIGNWKNVRVEGGKLRGRLELLAKGLSARIDELRALVEAKMLRAVSVGFKPLDAEALSGSKVGGVRFKKQELVECSLVSVPANPNALAIAKSLHISDDVKRLIFGETADEVSTVLRRGMPGEPAVSPHKSERPRRWQLSRTASWMRRMTSIAFVIS
jgi:HK97 family phage prohead protease